MSKTLNKYGKSAGRSWANLPAWTKIVGVVIVLLLLTPTIFQSTFVTGYDGVIAEIVSVKSDYAVQDRTVRTTSAYIKQASRAWLHDPCGLSMQIQGAVNVNKENATTFEPIISETDEYYKKWEITIYHCTMGVSLATSGGGLSAAEKVDFTIRLKENDFSFFTTANESFAYIIQVVTAHKATQSGIVNVIPEAGGYYFPLTTIDTDPVPDWARASGYNWGHLAKAQIVDFTIHVDNMQPTSLAFNFRGESQVDWLLEIDVLVMGHWHYIKPDKEWEPPPSDLPWYEALMAMMPSIALGLGGIIGVVIIAVIGVVILKATVLKKGVEKSTGGLF